MKKIASPFSEQLLKNDAVVIAAQTPKKTEETSTNLPASSGHSPVVWMSLMFVFSVLYLFPEAVFNALLTEVAGGQNSSHDDLRVAELFGRTISGIGVSLLIADLVIKGRFFQPLLRSVLAFVGILVVIWPLVFFGQKWLVDHFIVDPSTPEQRQQAFFSQLLRKALIENSIQIEGVDYQPDKVQTAEEKTFLSVIGGLVYADTALISTLHDRKKDIVGKFVHDQAMNNFDRYYSDYDRFRSELKTQYKSYREKSNEYNQAINSSQKRADKYWLEVQNEVKAGWSKYQKAEAAFEARLDARAQKIGPKVYKYYKRRDSCSNRSSASSRQYCFESADERYRDIFNDMRGVPYIEPNAWLIKEEVSAVENGLTTLLTGVLTGGVSTALQLVDKATGGDGGIRDYRYLYTQDLNHYKKVLREHLKDDFKKESSGYPLGIENLNAFRFHDVTSKKVRKNLVKKGLSLPSSWKLSQRRSFNHAVSVKVRKEADKRWNQGIRKKGLNIKPNLSWKQFQLNASVQRKIKARAGDIYVKPMLADWNNVQFKKHVVDVNIRKKTQEYIQILNAHEKEFADGYSLSEKGKEAIRATIVPPVSMSLSLFLVLMTIIKLPGKGLTLYRQFKPSEDSGDGKNNKKKQLAVSIIPILAILLIPTLAWENKYTEDKSAVNYFLDKVEKESSIVTSAALNWLLSTQPVLQPFGQALDNNLNVTSGFASVQPVVEWLDHRVFAAPQKTVLKKRTAGQKLPLKISTNVAGAKISIMNIKPVYYDNMLLAAGSYDVKVSAPGHKPVRKWIKLNPDQRHFRINL